jgi:hypothetical protein
LERNWTQIDHLLRDPFVACAGYVDPKNFRAALVEMRNGQVPRYFLRLLKALSLELWLREVTSRGVIAIEPDRLAKVRPEIVADRLRTNRHHQQSADQSTLEVMRSGDRDS